MANTSNCNHRSDVNGNQRCSNVVTIRQSDFSIDHILNRAGAPKFCDRNNGDLPKAVMGCDSYEQIAEQPIFDWIYYTRYRPPKLPRPQKQGPVKRSAGRLPRVPFTPAQLQSLEEAYTKSTYLSADDAETIAHNLYLTSTRVKIWFQNRRARDRRERKDDNHSPLIDVDEQPSQPINYSVSSSDYFLSTSGPATMNSSMERRSSF